MVSSVLGWETVAFNNSSGSSGFRHDAGHDDAIRPGGAGAPAEHAIGRGVSLAEAITSALYNVAGVTSLTFQENVAATTQTINGISMVGHSAAPASRGHQHGRGSGAAREQEFRLRHGTAAPASASSNRPAARLTLCLLTVRLVCRF